MNHRSVGTCPTHRKKWYRSRKDARAIARRHPTHKVTYRCQVTPDLWHVGELSQTVITGRMDRSFYYRKAA